eukprot:297307-Rhodomonas_salina.2
MYARSASGNAGDKCRRMPVCAEGVEGLDGACWGEHPARVSGWRARVSHAPSLTVIFLDSPDLTCRHWVAALSEDPRRATQPPSTPTAGDQISSSSRRKPTRHREQARGPDRARRRRIVH